MTSVEENGTMENSDIGETNDSQGSNSWETKGVEALLESEEFKREIVRLVNTQMKSGGKPVSALQQLSDLLSQTKSTPKTQQKISRPQRNYYDRPCANGTTIPINDLRGNEGTAFSKEEKSLRCKLAAMYRLTDMNGWTQSIYSHITVRVTEGEESFLINPFGFLFHEITASSLIKIDCAGDVIDQGSTVLGVNRAGWILHSTLHEARKDVNCVYHIHAPDTIAVSCLKCGLLPLCQEAATLLAPVDEGGAGVSYHGFQGILVDEVEKDSIVKDFGPVNKVLILNNHGVVVCGSTPEEAWKLMRLLVTACQTQMRMIQLGGDSVLNGESSCTPSSGPRLRGSGYRNPEEAGIWGPGELEFEAMMRMLDNGGHRTGYVYKQPNLLRRQQCPGASEEGLDTLGYETSGHFDYGDESAQTAKSVSQNRQSRQKAAQRTEWLAKAGSLERKGIEEESITTVLRSPVSPGPTGLEITPAMSRPESPPPASLIYSTPKKTHTLPSVVVESPESQGSPICNSTPVSPLKNSDTSANDVVSKSKTLPLHLKPDTMSGESEPGSRSATLKSDASSPDESPKGKKSKKKGIRIPSFSKNKKK